MYKTDERLGRVFKDFLTIDHCDLDIVQICNYLSANIVTAYYVQLQSKIIKKS